MGEISASLNCGSLGIGDPSSLLHYTPIKKRSIAHLLENMLVLSPTWFTLSDVVLPVALASSLVEVFPCPLVR